MSQDSACAVIQADVIDYLRPMKLPIFNCIFADPPYNIGLNYDGHDDNLPRSVYLSWTRKWIYECERLLLPGGTFWLVINDEYQARLSLMLEELNLVQRNHIIWFYTFGVHCATKFSRSKAHVFYYTKPGDKHTWNRPLVPSTRQAIGDSRASSEGKTPDDVWQIPRLVGNAKERYDYPCQLPEELVRRCILSTTNEDDIVLDPFCGTGTTAAVCKQTDRNCITIDNSEKAFAIAKERICS